MVSTRNNDNDGNYARGSLRPERRCFCHQWTQRRGTRASTLSLKKATYFIENSNYTPYSACLLQATLATEDRPYPSFLIETASSNHTIPVGFTPTGYFTHTHSG